MSSTTEPLVMLEDILSVSEDEEGHREPAALEDDDHQTVPSFVTRYAALLQTKPRPRLDGDGDRPSHSPEPVADEQVRHWASPDAATHSVRDVLRTIQPRYSDHGDFEGDFA
eukprot:CAMPEP_0176421174 /NCGR_PEP_ID=MMETSP0127-20121128/9021_1 /TAXON_ID=938130 /ORGANISM="Platyophrya macrostoma, Strain WH" /LENGTH=111 /DNA_ID=CAMNT_0017801863 /DNA_START=65 /DNA_END=396 /DNA_ORIENTATION=+